MVPRNDSQTVDECTLITTKATNTAAAKLQTTASSTDKYLPVSGSSVSGSEGVTSLDTSGIPTLPKSTRKSVVGANGKPMPRKSISRRISSKLRKMMGQPKQAQTTRASKSVSEMNLAPIEEEPKEAEIEVATETEEKKETEEQASMFDLSKAGPSVLEAGTEEEMGKVYSVCSSDGGSFARTAFSGSTHGTDSLYTHTDADTLSMGQTTQATSFGYTTGGASTAYTTGTEETDDSLDMSVSEYSYQARDTSRLLIDETKMGIQNVDVPRVPISVEELEEMREVQTVDTHEMINFINKNQPGSVTLKNVVDRDTSKDKERSTNFSQTQQQSREIKQTDTHDMIDFINLNQPGSVALKDVMDRDTSKDQERSMRTKESKSTITKNAPAEILNKAPSIPTATDAQPGIQQANTEDMIDYINQHRPKATGMCVGEETMEVIGRDFIAKKSILKSKSNDSTPAINRVNTIDMVQYIAEQRPKTDTSEITVIGRKGFNYKTKSTDIPPRIDSVSTQDMIDYVAEQRDPSDTNVIDVIGSTASSKRTKKIRQNSSRQIEQSSTEDMIDYIQQHRPKGAGGLFCGQSDGVIEVMGR